jgi:hypothetical protein
MALALAGVDRDETLARLAELLLQFEQDHSPGTNRADSTARIPSSPSESA